MDEENQIDENETTRAQLPSELYSEIMREVEDKKQKLSKETEKLGLTSEILSDSKPIIQALDEVARVGKPDPVATSTYQILYNLGHQVKALDPLLGQVNLQCNNLVSNASFVANATASTASFVKWPENFALPNIDNVRNKRQTFDEHEKYALMLERIDPSLGETFRSINSAYFGSTHDRVRVAIEQARQAWDHLIRKLVRDEDVKTQSWWPNYFSDPQDPHKVTRMQRFRLAVEKYVDDPNQQKILISEDSHINEVYKRLQAFHTPGPIDGIKEKDALFVMVGIIKGFVDSVNWGRFQRKGLTT